MQHAFRLGAEPSWARCVSGAPVRREDGDGRECYLSVSTQSCRNCGSRVQFCPGRVDCRSCLALAAQVNGGKTKSPALWPGIFFAASSRLLNVARGDTDASASAMVRVRQVGFSGLVGAVLGGGKRTRVNSPQCCPGQSRTLSETSPLPSLRSSRAQGLRSRRQQLGSRGETGTGRADADQDCACGRPSMPSRADFTVAISLRSLKGFASQPSGCANSARAFTAASDSAEANTLRMPKR